MVPYGKGGGGSNISVYVSSTAKILTTPGEQGTFQVLMAMESAGPKPPREVVHAWLMKIQEVI